MGVAKCLHRTDCKWFQGESKLNNIQDVIEKVTNMIVPKILFENSILECKN